MRKPLLIAATLVAPHAADAQFWLRDAEAFGLDKAAWSAMGEATTSLLSVNAPEPGASTRWSSDGGMSGVATVETVEPRADGATCATIRHEITAAARNETTTARSRRCDSGDGQWKLSVE